METGRPVLTRWADTPLQNMRGAITRRFVHSDKMMIAQVNFAKGDTVPAHAHENEQYTYVLSGALRFRFGEDQTEEILVSEGEIVLIPSGLLHSAVAEQDTFELDIFCPPRADWINGDDAYLRE